MKVRLNQKVLAEMDPLVRSLVVEWKTKWRKVFISVNTRPSFFVHEDEKVTLINLATSVQQSARVAGEWAGLTKLAPGAEVTLPKGIVAVCTGFFCGHPYLTIYQGSKPQLKDAPLPYPDIDDD